MEKGKLFVVGTPIGNLGDITTRAIDTLNKVPFVLCEDTRVTGQLLKKYKVGTQMVSYRDQNHDQLIAKVFEKLDMGLNLALVSDAGMPLISDPGYKLVRDVKDASYEVVVVPGATALTAALAISGLPTDRFFFAGFLPKGAGQRKKMLKIYGALDATLIFYESPLRVERLVNEIHEELGNRKVSLCKELTKMHEESITAYAADLLKQFENGELKDRMRGEFVVLVGKEGI